MPPPKWATCISVPVPPVAIDEFFGAVPQLDPFHRHSPDPHTAASKQSCPVVGSCRPARPIATLLPTCAAKPIDVHVFGVALGREYTCPDAFVYFAPTPIYAVPPSSEKATL